MSYTKTALKVVSATALPGTWAADTAYYITIGNPAQTDPAAPDYPRTEVYITDGSANAYPVGNNTLIDGRIAAAATGGETSTPPAITGTTYYIDPATGSDANPGTIGSPWQTTGRISTKTFAAGDGVLLKRGAIYTNPFQLFQSGTSGNPIVLSAYGTGEKPVISGMVTLSSWTNEGGGIYSASLNAGAYLRVVTVNGVMRDMGRFPNAGQPWNTITGHTFTLNPDNSSYGTVTSAAVNGQNWTGADMMIRKHDWVLDRCPITAHSGSVITYTSDTQHPPKDFYGFFVQNHLATVTDFGEWYYNPSTQKLYMHFGGGVPGSYTVKAAVPGTLVNIASRSYVTIDNLNLGGSNAYTINMQDAGNVLIQNCKTFLCGGDTINGYYATYISILDNTMEDSGNSCMTFLNTPGLQIKRNTIRRCGLLPGLGKSNNGQRMGFLAQNMSLYSVIEDNIIEDVGYCGMMWSGSDVVIRRNFVNGHNKTVTDGGGIYTWENRTKYNRKVYQNVVINGIGENFGTSEPAYFGAFGIYNDDLVGNVEYFQNYSAHNSRAGLYFHNAHHMLAYNNVLYDNKEAQLLMVHDSIGIDVDGVPGDNYPIRFINFQRNQLIAKDESQAVIKYFSMTADHAQVGVFDYNSYNQPYGHTGLGVIIGTWDSGEGTYKSFNLGINGWKTKYSKDTNSTQSPYSYAAFTQLTQGASNRAYNSTFADTSFMAPGNGTASVETKITGSSLKVIANSSNGSYVDLQFFFSGSVVSGTKYKFKFDVIVNAGDNGYSLDCYMQENGGTYGAISATKSVEVKSAVTTIEIMLTATSSVSAASFKLRWIDDVSPIWFDNVDIRDITATVIDPSTITRGEYNQLNVPATKTIPGTWVDGLSNIYTSKISLDRNQGAALILKP